MKNLKKILATTLIVTMLVTVSSCNKVDKENQAKVDDKSFSDDLGAVRFLDTDWGMTVDEALEALNLTMDDVVLRENSGDAPESIKVYEIKDKVKINGMEGKATLTFCGKVSDYVKDMTSENKDTYIGLSGVFIELDEKDKDKLYKAFDDELGKERDYSEYGVSSKSIVLSDIQDISKEAFDKYIELYRGSESPVLNINSPQLSRFIVGNDEEHKNYHITYEDQELAVLNNLNK